MVNSEATNFVNRFFKLIDIDTNHADGFDRFAIIAIITLVAVLIAVVSRWLVSFTVTRLSSEKKYRWQELILDPRVLKKVVDIVPVILIYTAAPLAFTADDKLLIVVQKFCVLYMIVIAAIFINQVLRVLFEIFNHREMMRDKPLKGVLQIIQVGLFTVTLIIIISMLVNKSPATLLAGLGASAAVLMLIFKDSILGFVSGVQLSANQMLRKGDWISLPKYDVNGTVIDVTLTTVKVRNFDNTILTIPPYVLTNESFQNWRGMQESGGRRIMQSINIDINSVKFCTPEMIEKYRKIVLIKDYIDSKEIEIGSYNKEHNLLDEVLINERRQTNIGVFRAYLKRYIEHLSSIDKNQTYMVRYLSPTETGIPVQVYFFSNVIEWVSFEGVQADVLDHILAVIPEFDLYVFQNPAGMDIRNLHMSLDNSVKDNPKP